MKSVKCLAFILLLQISLTVYIPDKVVGDEIGSEEEFLVCKEEPGVCKSGETNVKAKAESKLPDGSKYVIKEFEKEYGECAPPEDLDCASISIQYPEITESTSKTAMDSVNSFIEKSLLKWADKDPESFDEMANQFFEGYKSFDEGFDSPIGWSLERNVEVVYNTPKVLSISISDYQFTGGAHPNSFLIYASFNMSTGEKIKLSDILVDGYEAELNAIGEKEFRKVREVEPGQNLEEAGFWFENDKFSLNDNFAITEDGLIFFYNSYDVAPYAAGPTELELNYEAIKNLMRKDGLSEKNKN